MRPKKYGCHGQLVATHGTSLTSAWSDTGLVVSGVPDVTMRSTLSERISSEATSAARLPFDWLSLEMICDLVGPAAALQAPAENIADLPRMYVVGLAEAGERAGLRADVADLDDRACALAQLAPSSAGAATAAADARADDPRFASSSCCLAAICVPAV